MSGYELSRVIRKIAMDSNEASNPDKIILGKITECSTIEKSVFTYIPMIIQISDKFILKEGDPYLIFTKNMRSKLGNRTEPYYFQKGDDVILMRTGGGSKFILLDVI